MDKVEFLNQLLESHSSWKALLGQVPECAMELPGVCGKWSVKDVIAHVTWFEREMVGMLQARALVGLDLWNLPGDDRNEAIYQQNSQRTLEDIRSEAAEVLPLLVAGMDGLADQDLLSPEGFRGMPPEWIPWQVIASNTFEHYDNHSQDIRKWLESENHDRHYRFRCG
jgi:hypothetical protein